MIKIVLKTLKEIEETTITEDAEEKGKVKHTNGVWYVKDIIKELRAMNCIVVEDINVYSDMYAIGVIKPNGNTTYISPSWVKSMAYTDATGTEIEARNPMSLAPKKSSGYVSLTPTRLLDMAKMAIVDTADIPMCACGTMIENNPKLKELGICSSCAIEKFYEVESYNYKPTPAFTGEQIKGDKETPTWYGIELEYGVNDKMPIAMLTQQFPIYLKNDSSIERGTDGGVEVVTHPHSFTKLMEKDGLVDNISTIDCNSSDANGCHIHMGRTAWKDDTHYALMYYLMYELGKEGILEAIGGRKFTGYCQFDKPTEKIHKKGKDKTGGDRTLWANESNGTTVEFRFFKGTNNPKELKRYIQLLEGVLKYTKYHSKTVSIDGLVAYLKSKPAKYAELIEFIAGLSFTNKNVEYRPPIAKFLHFDALPFGNVHDISEVTLKDGDVIAGITKVVVENDKLYVYGQRGTNRGVRFTEIKSVTIEV